MKDRAQGLEGSPVTARLAFSPNVSACALPSLPDCPNRESAQPGTQRPVPRGPIGRLRMRSASFVHGT